MERQRDQHRQTEEGMRVTCLQTSGASGIGIGSTAGKDLIEVGFTAQVPATLRKGMDTFSGGKTDCFQRWGEALQPLGPPQ